MFRHHTKDKGDYGVLKVKLDLLEQGFLILNPETEHAPFDLVIYKNGVYKSVQVKYRSLNKRGVLEVPFRSTYCNTNGLVVKMVDKLTVDIYAVYCPETDTCYYFDPREFGSSVALRIRGCKNNQELGVHYADDFRKIKFLDDGA